MWYYWSKMATKISSKDKKFKELVIYLTNKSYADPKCGLTKLNKLLFFSDAFAFANLGKPITGQKYFTHINGPIPADMELLRRELIEDRDTIERSIPVIDYSMTKIIPSRQADLSVFTAEEIDLVNEVLEFLKNKNNTQASQFSHDKSVGWQNTEINEEIPLSTIFFPVGMRYTEDDITYTEALIRKHGWADKYGWDSQQSS